MSFKLRQTPNIKQQTAQRGNIMKTVTQLRNTETKAIIVLNTADSKAEQFRSAVAKGCDLGKTSFTNMSNGKVATSKNWVYETVEVQPEAPKKKAMPLGLDRMSMADIAKAAKACTAPRRRRDMAEVFEAARNHKQHGEWVRMMEAAGFNICHVDKKDRWFCINLVGQEVGRKHARVDISPLKNGNFNFSLYVNGKATGDKKTLQAADATPAAILKTAQEFRA